MSGCQLLSLQLSFFHSLYDLSHFYSVRSSFVSTLSLTSVFVTPPLSVAVQKRNKNF